MLVACGSAALDVADGAMVPLDADARSIDLAPDATHLVDAVRAASDARRNAAVALSAAHETCRTSDGVRIEVFANCGSAAPFGAAAAAGAEACGLLRTEFLSSTAPARRRRMSRPTPTPRSPVNSEADR